MPIHYQVQLDFIIFFNGLAFFLLGVLCSIAARGRLIGAPTVRMIGLFGFVHGIAEWMAMAALVTGDTAEFALIRSATIVGSFMLLTEVARLDAIRFGLRPPGRWIYPAGALALALTGYLAGLPTADALGRYSFGLIGAVGTGAMTFVGRNDYDRALRPIKISLAAGFVIYGIAAGLVGAPAPFWPADVVNEISFVQVVGVPIQLVRAAIAILLSLLTSIAWGWFLTEAVHSRLYSAYLRRQAFCGFGALMLILALGWTFTNAIGDIIRVKIEREATGESDVLVGSVARETATLDAMVQVLAGQSLAARVVERGAGADVAELQAMLELDARATGARLGAIFNSSGYVLASTERRHVEMLGASNRQAERWFSDAIRGVRGRAFQIDATGARSYLTAYPVRAPSGAVVGVAALEISLEALDAQLHRFDHAFFVVDPRGVVLLSNRHDELQRTLWPRGKMPPQNLNEQFGARERPTMLAREIEGGEWIVIEGRPGYAVRRTIRDSKWSLVLAIPMTEMFAGRLLGIIITLQVMITALIVLMGRESGIRDRIQGVRRRQLQHRARNLSHKAATDALTGIANRLRFNERLEEERLRSERSGAVFSLILFDIDSFKTINDRFGHPRGDQVLVELARTVGANVRQTDLLARWGGEEFVILLVDSGALGAVEIAEKLRLLIAHTPFDEVGTVTSSFGVAEFRPRESGESLLSRADHALYRAKLRGRNRVELDQPEVETVALAPALSVR